MTATVVETEVYQVVKAEIVQTTWKEEDLDYCRFYGMMSYSDFVVFEDEVRRGLRSINGPYEISK